MSWVQTLAVVVHVLFAFAIIALVLLQRGRGADAGAGFGAGASGTVFGARGSGSFLSRTTAILATLFFITSLGLSYLFSRGAVSTSVVDRVPTEIPAPSGTQPPAGLLPAVPAETAPATTAPQLPAVPAEPPATTVPPAAPEGGQ